MQTTTTPDSRMRSIFKYVILATALLLPLQWASAARPAAKTVIESMTKKLRDAQSLTAGFTIKQGGNSSQGSLTMSGKAFRLKSPEMQVWFDGTTQWAYSPAAGEVNVTTPTKAEIAESNPLSVLTSMSGAYTCRRLASSAGTDKIELVPREKTDISKAVVTISATTGYPTEIVVYTNNGMVTQIAISSVKTGKKMSAAEFRFNKKDFPGVEVVDLR